MNIVPLIGFDDVTFGDSREQVLNVLGEPAEKHDVDFPDGASTESWVYDELDVELNFDSVRTQFATLERHRQPSDEGHGEGESAVE